MRIGFYIHHSMLKAGGIYTYSIGILRMLLKSESIKSLVIFTTPEIKSNLNDFISNPKVEIKTFNRNSTLFKLRFMTSFFLQDISIVYGRINNKSKVIRFLKSFSVKINPFNSVINKSGVQLFHVPMQYSPIYGASVPIITTMHDLQEFHFPENFSSVERIHRSINNHKSIYDSNKIIVSFDHIKKDILKYYKVSEEKISVCPPPFAEDWFTSKKETDWNILKTKYEISKKFLLYPAATWPHKNHLLLLNAYKDILGKIEDLTLICTGYQTEYFNIIQQKISELKIQNNVKFLGIVPEENLIGLYKNCELVVIPTLYEAGSGPLYEAMRYKAPVICANTTSLPETIGDKNFIFDPYDEKYLSELIEKLISDKTLKELNIKNSTKRMEELAEYNYAKNFIDIYSKFNRY
jgi:glycosyltransferase involved in cell wall biosynthesis